MTRYDFYSYSGSPNTQKVAIALSETGLTFQRIGIDITAGDQKTPEFLARNPNNKVPVLVDTASGISYVESGAILLHIADVSGQLAPAALQQKIREWMFFQAAHIGPSMGQLWNYRVFVSEKLPTVIDRFEKESYRLFGVLDQQLAKTRHIAGDEFTLADIMLWPWIRVHDVIGLSLENYPALKGWFDAVGQRPGVQQGLAAA